MSITPETTVGELVAADFRAAAVLSRFGIDFCCGGRRTIAEACSTRNVDAADVMREISANCAAGDGTTPRFNEWEPQTLVAYIVGNHHSYVRRALPAIGAYTRKLAATHGGAHPELVEIESLFAQVTAEMTSHMAKEEQILFPYIVELGDAVPRGEEIPPAPFGSIDNPIRMMEEEHEMAGAAMARIRELSGGYVPPPDGCTTYRVCFKELEAFERDLHAHVHLENNVLFPKARALAES